MDKFLVRLKIFTRPAVCILIFIAGIFYFSCSMSGILAAPIKEEKAFDARPLSTKALEVKKAVLPERGFNGSPLKVPTGKTPISQEKGFDNRTLLRLSYVAEDLSLKREFIAPEGIAPSMLVSGSLPEESLREKGFDSGALAPMAKAKGEEAGYLLSEQEPKKVAYSEKERLKELEKVFEIRGPEAVPPEKERLEETLKAKEPVPPPERPSVPTAPARAELPPPGKEAIYHFNLGVSYQKQGNIRKAIEEYEKVLELDPYNAEAHNNLGIIYKEKGDLDKAVEHYQLVISLNPGMEEARNNLGVIHYLRGNPRAAELEYEKVLKINPDNLVGRINLGIVYKAQKLERKAIDTFEKVLAMDPFYPEAHYNLAILYEELGHLEKAIWYYNRFIANAGNSYPEVVKKVAKRIEQLKVISGEELREYKGIK
ncbi:MAG: tetratricopeptide repeat protein [Candidatus Brocadiales bacterium]|nr:tetratricopeptide repeat protein [Candidatus Brocadiales bacterium]